MKKRTIIFLVTEDWYFCSHRLPLALAAQKADFDVIVATRTNYHGRHIEDAGLTLIPLKLSRHSINPIQEILLIKQIISIYKKEHPNIVHHVALKPVIYGSIAAWIAKVPYTVNALAGLGYLFSSASFKARFLRFPALFLFRLLLNRRNSSVILQNPDDVNLLCDLSILDKQHIALIRGSGVDPEKFVSKPEPPGPPRVILAARMLWDKGVGEFVNAARLLKQQGLSAHFVLVGATDPENPSTISSDQLKKWHEEGNIEFWGQREDMPTVLAKSHIVCLPSYREGLPKILVEAASCGRPIVTTDAPGCREIVQNGINGILVPLQDAPAVAEALKKLILSPKLRQQMGVQGRKMVKKNFSLDKINTQTLNLYNKLMR